MNYLTEEEIRKINKKVIEESGGTSGAVNEANLSHVCDRAKTVGQTVLEKAAYYLHTMAYSHHIFTDGNKRTSLAACESFLEKNYYQIEARDSDLVGTVLLIASGNMEVKETEKWLKERVKRTKT